jgi:hypothetical protein
MCCELAGNVALGCTVILARVVTSRRRSRGPAGAAPGRAAVRTRVFLSAGPEAMATVAPKPRMEPPADFPMSPPTGRSPASNAARTLAEMSKTK